MASADFCPSQAVSPLLVAALAGFASPPPAVGQTSPGKNNNLPPMYPPHLLRCAPGSGRALFCLANSPTHLSLICGFCSSGRDFAAGFLQIPPHDGHPCLWLTLLAAKRVADSHRRVIAHAGRTTKSRMNLKVHPALAFEKPSFSFSSHCTCTSVHLKSARSYNSLLPRWRYWPHRIPAFRWHRRHRNSRPKHRLP